MTVHCARCDKEGQGTAEQLPNGWQHQASTMTKSGFIVCATCSASSAPAVAATRDSASDQLRLFIERIERIEEEIKGAQDDRKDVYAEAKATGYDVKVMREIVRRRGMDGHALREFEGLLETYQDALGMGVDGARRDSGGRASTSAHDDEEEDDDDGDGDDSGAGAADYLSAVALVREHGKASTSWLQRQMRIGYNSAACLIEQMEGEGIVSPPDHVGRRTLLREEA